MVLLAWCSSLSFRYLPAIQCDLWCELSSAFLIICSLSIPKALFMQHSWHWTMLCCFHGNLWQHITVRLDRYTIPHFPSCQSSAKPYYVRSKVYLSSILSLTVAKDKWLGKSVRTGQEYINIGINPNFHNFGTWGVKSLIQRPLRDFFSPSFSWLCHFLDLCNKPEWDHTIIQFIRDFRRSLVWPPPPAQSWVSYEILPGFSGLYPVGFSQAPRMKTAHPFWATIFFTHLDDYV